ncbi:MAG: hypothetical protein M1833_004721 [Piccolia ochrophora]|nr:MAG: hypothetical protein M1833_004721 [Piccolia ochrophora]
MATSAHCLFCFETLLASLDSRPPLTLPQIQELWQKYTSAQRETQGEEQDEEQEELDTDDSPDQDDEEPISRRRRLRTHLDRLAVPSPASGASSSSPSTVSTSSTRTPTSSGLGSSSNSSSSSFFSFGRKAHRRQQPPARDEDRPLFVTWNTISRAGNKNLRGCIGTFEAQELESGLRNYALTSAFDDSRFMPITKRELRNLEVGVTLLTDFEPAPDPTSWTLGTHGLRISFTYHSKRYGATYLPDVPVDQGWTKEETLVSLMRKAGWSGRKEDWRKVGDLKVVRYQGKKVVMEYEEWMAWRGWAQKMGHV